SPDTVLLAGKHRCSAGSRGGRMIAPDVVVAIGRGAVMARRLEPWVLDGRVVGDEIDDDADALLAGSLDEEEEVFERAVAGIDAEIVGDVVAVVEIRGWEEGQEPEA